MDSREEFIVKEGKFRQKLYESLESDEEFCEETPVSDDDRERLLPKFYYDEEGKLILNPKGVHYNYDTGEEIKTDDILDEIEYRKDPTAYAGRNIEDFPEEDPNDPYDHLDMHPKDVEEALKFKPKLKKKGELMFDDNNLELGVYDESSDQKSKSKNSKEAGTSEEFEDAFLDPRRKEKLDLK